MTTSHKLIKWRHAHRQVAPAKAALDMLDADADEWSLSVARAVLNGCLVEQALRFAKLSRRDRAIALKEMNP